jgi:hypothetical protein
MKRLTRQVHLLRVLYGANASLRKIMLRKASKDFLYCLSDVAYNLLHGNLPLTRRQRAALKRHKKTIRLLGQHKTSADMIRKELLQKQKPFYRALLGPLLEKI